MATRRQILTVSLDPPHTIISIDTKKRKGPTTLYRGMKLIPMMLIMEACAWEGPSKGPHLPRSFLSLYANLTLSARISHIFFCPKPLKPVFHDIKDDGLFL
jgi:hypothetical protein